MREDNVAVFATLYPVQLHYMETCVYRGWNKESPTQCALLLSEEVGELARCVRKTTGMKRSDGYDGIDTEKEVGDVFLSLVALANSLKINLADAVTHAEKINHEKWARAHPEKG